MMTISLELPEGVAPPKMRGTLTGPPDDLRIEIRLADFVSALKEAQAAGATVQMVPHGVVVDTAPVDPPTPLPFKLAKKSGKKAPAKRADSVSTGTRPSPSQDAIVDYLRNGDRTRSELIKAVAEQLQTSVDAVGQAFEKVKAKGLVEKYEDANNGGLPKWRLVRK